VAESEDARRFDEIVARLHEEDPGFTAAFFEEARPPGRGWLIVGVVLCVVALVMLAFGGVKGAVLAVFPWLCGMACVLKGRG
jgi:hypothetical protein